MVELAVTERPISGIAPIEDIIEEARHGRRFILIDDDAAAGGGSLVIPAQMATPDALNFMAVHARGLICLALTSARIDQLNLQPMSAGGHRSGRNAFTVSIEAREGVSTGISTADRSRTIMTAIDWSKDGTALVSPGHVFPLAARPGGVLARAGRTEAGIDIARLAGMNPSAVICEIMRDDGALADLDDLLNLAARHSMKVGTIQDLIRYRRRHDHLVVKKSERALDLSIGSDWRVMEYQSRIDGTDHVVLAKGKVTADTPTLVRMHSLSLLDDAFGAVGPRGEQLKRAMHAIEAEGRGILVLFQPSARLGLTGGADTLDGPEMDMRGYGIGAQILADLDVQSMVLLTNSPSHMVALEGWGISIDGFRAIGA